MSLTVLIRLGSFALRFEGWLWVMGAWACGGGAVTVDVGGSEALPKSPNESSDLSSCDAVGYIPGVEAGLVSVIDTFWLGSSLKSPKSSSLPSKGGG